MINWFKHKVFNPIYDFLYSRFCWVESQGQVFKDTNSVHVQWDEKYTSIIERSQNPELFKKFQDVPHGSVILCERIWTPSGFLRDVRDIQIILSQEEISQYNRTGIINCKPYLKESVATYSRRLSTFNTISEKK